jgi:thioredoxin 2
VPVVSPGAPAAMSEPVHLICGHCNAIVRVPAARLGESPRCPKCRHALFEGRPLALNAANFDKHLTRSDIPLVVDFWAPWCGPCRMMAPYYEQAAKEIEPKARLAKVNSDEEPALSARYGVRSIPTLVAFKRGREVARQSGAMDLNALLRWVDSAVS